MVTCRTFVEFLMGYLAGELDDAERDEFDAHLAVCKACVAYMSQYARTIELGKAAFADPDAGVPGDVPGDLIKAVLAARRAGN